ARDVPELERVVATGAEQSSAVRRESHGRAAALMFTQRGHAWLIGGERSHVNQANEGVYVRNGQERAVGREGQAIDPGIPPRDDALPGSGHVHERDPQSVEATDGDRLAVWGKGEGANIARQV